MFRLIGVCCVAFAIIIPTTIQLSRTYFAGYSEKSNVQLARKDRRVHSPGSQVPRHNWMSQNATRVHKEAFEAMIQAARYDYKPNCLIYWGSEKCSGCKKIEPLIKKLRDDGYTVYFVDFHANRALAKKNKVATLPTLIIHTNNKEVKRLQGETVSRADILKHLKKNKPDDYDIW